MRRFSAVLLPSLGDIEGCFHVWVVMRAMAGRGMMGCDRANRDSHDQVTLLSTKLPLDIPNFHDASIPDLLAGIQSAVQTVISGIVCGRQWYRLHDTCHQWVNRRAQSL